MKEHSPDGSVTPPFGDRPVKPRLELNRGDEIVFDCLEPHRVNHMPLQLFPA